MYQITTSTLEHKLTVYELRDAGANSWVHLVPERGGIITGYGVNQRELLYLDQETLLNPASNIRGGIPILFPVSGAIANNQYEWDGVIYPMKQHGLVRNQAWQVIATETNEQYAAITIQTSSDAQTRESYPFDYELRFTIILQDQQLTIKQVYYNHSDRPMPMYAGFHPYFLADQKKLAYETDASTLLDMNDLHEKPFTGEIDLDVLPESVVFLQAPTPQISFSPRVGTQIELTYSDVFEYVVLWSVAGKPFVCVEPWMGLPNGLNTKDKLVYVKPNEAFEAFFQFNCRAML